jgi:hypothetical protein
MNAIWPAEDAGPRRVQDARGPSPKGELTSVRHDLTGAHMVVVGEPDEVYVYGSTFGAGSTSWVARLEPRTLETMVRIDELPGGPWWPGGVALHDNGSLHVVHGRWAHRLSRALDVEASYELPRDRPYNSFVTLPDGNLVTKDLVLDGSAPSRLMVLEPDELRPVGVELDAPEPSISRLSADGDAVYLIGDHTAFRYRWDGARLALDDWSFRYRTADDQSYGWDPVIAGGQVWFMDNGEHRYAGTLRDKGVAEGPVHLVRVAVDDADDHELVEVCGLPSGAVTNPPLYDPGSRTAVAYDSANGVLAAFRFDGTALDPLWQRPLDTAGHLVWFPDDAVVMAYDHRETEDVVFLDLATGDERSRVATGSPMQSVVFPAAGDGVVYYCSFATVARID